MESIEFRTTLGSDGIISIPKNIGGKVRRGKVRVIIIEDEFRVSDRNDLTDSENAKDYIGDLMANPIKVDNSTPFLTKDELHDRRI